MTIEENKKYYDEWVKNTLTTPMCPLLTNPPISNEERREAEMYYEHFPSVGELHTFVLNKRIGKQMPPR